LLNDQLIAEVGYVFHLELSTAEYDTGIAGSDLSLNVCDNVECLVAYNGTFLIAKEAGNFPLFTRGGPNGLAISC